MHTILMPQPGLLEFLQTQPDLTVLSSGTDIFLRIKDATPGDFLFRLGQGFNAAQAREAQMKEHDEHVTAMMIEDIEKDYNMGIYTPAERDSKIAALKTPKQ